MRRAPASLVLAGLVLASIGLRVFLGREITTPFILVDELIHAELAESLVESGRFHVRGEPLTVTFLYPLLIAPAWLLGSMETTYAVAKAIGALLMSLAAVPVFLWGRTLVSATSALVAAALTLATPWLVLTGTLMAEVAFLPVFLAACWAIARALEAPTLARQAVALGACGLAAATRVQGLIVCAILAAAVIAYRRDLRRWWPTAAVLAVAGLALLVLPRGLGVYGGVDDPDYGAGSLARWIVYDLGVLALAVGVVPLAALVALRPRTAAERAFVAVAASATGWLLALAAVSSHWNPVGIKERYLLHAMPLLFLALVVWVERGAPRRWWAAAAAVPVVALPLGDLYDDPALLGNAFGLIPFYRLSLEVDGVRLLVAALAVAAAAVAWWRPVLVAPLVFAYLVAANAPVTAVLRNHSLGIEKLTRPAQWIDPHASGHVAYLNTSNYAPETLRGDLWSQWAPVWEAQFWNRDLERVISLEYPEPAPLPQIDAKLDWATGTIVGASARFVVADARFAVRGARLAENGRLKLWRADTPLALASMREGISAEGRADALAAYTSWVPARRVKVFVLGTRRDVTVSVGPLDARSGVGALTDAARSWRVPGEVAGGLTVEVPPAPFRVEVRLPEPAEVVFA